MNRYGYLLASVLFAVIEQSSYAQTCSSNISLTAPASRYELLSNGEVSDKLTGLVWQRCSLGLTWNGVACTGSISSYNWENALTVAKSVGDGWRMPNIKELQTIIERACFAPAINQTIFPDTPTNAYYWSSSPVVNLYIYAWPINFYNGVIAYGSYTGKNSEYYVRLVRDN